ADIARRSVALAGFVQRLDHHPAVDLAIHVQIDAKPAVLVDDTEDLDRPALFRAVEDEVPAPHLVGLLRNAFLRRGRLSGPASLLARLHPSQALRTSDTLHLLAVDTPAFPAQQFRDEPIPVGRLLTRQLLDAVD